MQQYGQNDKRSYQIVRDWLGRQMPALHLSSLLFRVALASSLIVCGLSFWPRSAAAQAFQEFPIPTGGSQPLEITTGPDGALWFAGSGTNNIGRITTTGTITEPAILSD